MEIWTTDMSEDVIKLDENKKIDSPVLKEQHE